MVINLKLAEPSQSQYSPQTKIEELESIRGVAALLVVFFHLPKWNDLLLTGFINNAYLMVDLFFVLSGFVISNAYAEKITSGKALLRFQFLRFGRLYPVHLIFLFVFAFFEVAKYYAKQKIGISGPNAQPFQVNTLTAFVEQLFLVQAVGPTGNAITFNRPAWSISVEFYTYLVFGLSVLLCYRSKQLLFGLLAGVALGLLASQHTFGSEELLRGIAGFFIGCLTASTIKDLKGKISGYYALLVILAIAVFLQGKATLVKDYDAVIYVLSAALIVTVVLAEGGLVKRLLNLKLLTWLGTISYAMYMSHGAIEWVANQFIRVVLKKPETVIIQGNAFPALSTTETWIAMGIILTTVLVVSSLVYRWVEKPFREKSRQFAFKHL